MNLMTQAEAASMIGKSRQYINELLREGKIKRHGKKVDFDELLLFRNGGADPARDAQREWNGGKGLPRGTKKNEVASTGEPEQSRANEPGSAKKKAPTYAEAKTKREVHMAQLAELTYRERKGELIDKATVSSIIDQAFSDINSALSDLPYRIKSNFPDITDEIIIFTDSFINDIKKSIAGKSIG